MLNWLENIGKAVGVVQADEDHDAQRPGLIDLQLGTRVFNDVPAAMRTELWLSQLHRDKGKGAQAASQYQSLLRQPLSQELIAEIEKDTHRTFPGNKELSSRRGQRALFNVLRAYAASDPKIGYTQGMAFLAGLLLTYLPEEADAFGALALVMQSRSLRDLYQPDMALLQVRLWQLGRLMPQDLAAHLEQHGVLPVLFASSWFLTLYAGDFPMSFSARIMDLVIAESYAAPMMKVAIHILERCKAELMAMDDMEDMVQLLRTKVPSWPLAALHDLLTQALATPWTTRQQAILLQINGAESVADAVARVEEAAARGSTSSPSINNTTKQQQAGPSTPALGGGATERKKLCPPGVVKAQWLPGTPVISLVSTDSARIQPMIGDVIIDPDLNKRLERYSSLTAVDTPAPSDSIGVSAVQLASADPSFQIPCSPFDDDGDEDDDDEFGSFQAGNVDSVASMMNELEVADGIGGDNTVNNHHVAYKMMPASSSMAAATSALIRPPQGTSHNIVDKN